MLLLSGIAALVCVPVGFAVAQVTRGSEEAVTHNDPDPSTDAVSLQDALDTASESDDQEAIDKAADAIRAEIESRMSPEDRAAARAAPEEADVPDDTLSYLPPGDVPEPLLKGCEKKLAEDREDHLCELIVLHDEGRVRAGAFNAEQQADALSASNR